MLDFRDLWNNRVIHRHYQPNLTERVQDALTRCHWKKWLSRALFFSITSQEWLDKIGEFSNTKGIVIQNGFDPHLFDVRETLENSAEEFLVLHTGSIYSHQRLEIFLEGCRLFLDRVNPKKFRVYFIGADRKGLPGQLSGYMHAPKKFIESFLDPSVCQVTRRIPKVDVARKILHSQLLLFPGLPTSPGTHLGKIFDYLGSGKNILMVPDDQSVVGGLIRETKSGSIANIPEEVCRVLTSCYQEWEESGSLAYAGNQGEIMKYTRENQVKKMAEAILQQI